MSGGLNIPIQNIYYLLCYAWDKLTEQDMVEVSAEDATSLANLFARVLITGTHHLLKRGFDRGYVAHHEWTGRLRGRIDFAEAIRRNTRSARLPCEFDDLSYNVLHSCILKATMRCLLRAEGLEFENHEGLVRLVRALNEVEDIELNSRLFGKVELHRNNQFYDFLLKVCELTHRNLLVSEKPGASEFKDFVRDHRQMAALFERFVFHFLRQHTRFAVAREDIRWRWTPANAGADGLLPKMQTDISLTSADRKLIIDCKFTPEATQHHHEAEKLRSAHLYQINAYMDNLEGKFADTCEMMLLYPAADPAAARRFPAEFVHRDHRIRICTINLNQPWQGIHNGLLALVE